MNTSKLMYVLFVVAILVGIVVATNSDQQVCGRHDHGSDDCKYCCRHKGLKSEAANSLRSLMSKHGGKFDCVCGEEYPRGECTSQKDNERCNLCCLLMGPKITPVMASNGNCMCFDGDEHIFRMKQGGL